MVNTIFHTNFHSTHLMSVWEKKRQEREQQKNMVFGGASQMSNPVVFQGAG